MKLYFLFCFVFFFIRTITYEGSMTAFAIKVKADCLLVTNKAKIQGPVSAVESRTNR